MMKVIAWFVGLLVLVGLMVSLAVGFLLATRPALGADPRLDQTVLEALQENNTLTVWRIHEPDMHVSGYLIAIDGVIIHRLKCKRDPQ